MDKRVEVKSVAPHSSLMNIVYLAVWMKVIWSFFDHAPVLFFITLFFSGLCIFLMVLDLVLQTFFKQDAVIDGTPEV
ncbi:MAG: hypothetical protein Q8K61_04150 [Gallionella sp.]|nr:hypothetical protein [Gallionella sp.]